MNESRPTQVKSITTAIRIIEGLERLERAGVTQLASELGIAKSTVHDHLKTLEHHDFVVKDEDGYQLGLRFLDHGGLVRSRMELHEIARPEVEKLAEQTGELANLVVEEHGYGVYLAVEPGTNAVHIDSYVGKREHLHSTAVGKAILAHYPRERVEAILDRHGLPAETEHTITSREALFDQLEEIKQRGVAFDSEERLAGLRCVAAPIQKSDGDVVGAVSVSGPTSRLKDHRFEEELPNLLIQTSNIIEINVTYS